MPPQGKPDLTIQLTKMAGAGNDFVMIDNRSGELSDVSELTRRICTRRLSVGADGVILIESSTRATFKMRYLNADGSEADFCANGTRCAARFAFLRGAPGSMTIETGAGIIPAEIVDSKVTLTLPPPVEFQQMCALTLASGIEVRGSFLMVGVPHYVIFLKERLWEQNIEPVGKEIRRHPALQPRGANVNFVVVEGRHSIEVRTYERGVENETLACGSGVVASVSVSAMTGQVDSPVSVLTRSGIRLDVAFSARSEGGVRQLGEIRLTGDARVIYEGRLTSETMGGFDPDWVQDPTQAKVEA